jgi:hypothetical protein
MPDLIGHLYCPENKYKKGKQEMESLSWGPVYSFSGRLSYMKDFAVPKRIE